MKNNKKINLIKYDKYFKIYLFILTIIIINVCYKKKWGKRECSF
jgi:hypothetical protein